MSRRKIDHEVLKNLSTVQFASKYNFSPFLSPRAQTLKGSLIWASRLFERLANPKINKIREIKTYGRVGRKSRLNTFYTLTDEGAKSIEAQSYKYISPKSNTSLEHESAKIDVMLGFVYGFQEYLVHIDYNFIFKDIKYCPDAHVRLTTLDGKKTYDFIVEIERTRTARQIKEEKLNRINKIDFKKYGLSEHTKALIVYTFERYDVFLRPVEYIYHQDQIDIVNRNFQTLLGYSKDCSPQRFLFTQLHNFSSPNKPVWLSADGLKRPLISANSY